MPLDVPAVPRGAGRPRDSTREAAILDSTFALLADVGYERLTIEAVALRAGVSKATIYRRWQGKPALVVEALRQQAPGPSWPNTGSLRTDLLAGLEQMAAFLSSSAGRVAVGLTWAMQSDAELAQALRRSVLQDKGSECGLLLERALARGEITAVGPAAELLPAMFFGLLHAQVVVAGAAADATFRASVVDHVLLPALRAPYTPATPEENS